MELPGTVAFAYFAASRLAYVVGVGAMLKRQESSQFFTRDGDVEGGYRRFRRIAAILMNNDGVAFVVVCLATRGSLAFAVPAVPMICGTILCVIGVGTKVWAAKRLGQGGYYWRDFFAPQEHALPDPPGPYRFLKNPMYTLGYLQAYGLALFLRSGPGLVAAAFAQLAIMVFHVLVEKPHFEHLTGGS
jgi:protein-S-isoprenylcysteine O-methyltransferase Ste14